ncbi:MAG: ankyrin repeat domain-containing protein, partial [Longimicrobiales bacterium]
NLRRRPLHLAVAKERADSLATLLELGADREATDATGLTALDQAALHGEAGMVRLLLDHGAEVKLPAAIALERTADIERLLDERPDELKRGGRYETLIVHAAARAAGSVIRALIRAGASPNARDDADTAVDQAEGYTALHAAAFHGNRQAIEVLLEHGADPNVRDGKYCGTPAGWADYAGHREVRDLILTGRIDPFQAIDFDRPDRIAEIVRQSPWLLTKRFSHSVTCEPRPDQGWPEPWQTPLARAVVSGKPVAVRALLEHGAPQIAAPDGRSLREIAGEKQNAEIVELLERHRRIEATHEGRVRWFVKNACPDHDIRGPAAHVIASNTAQRMLRAHPEIARDSFYTAIVCGSIAEV